MGGKSSAPSTTTTTQNLDPVVQAAVKKNLEIADQLAQRPYQPYRGDTVAGFSPYQAAAMQGILGSQGMAMPYLQGAGNAYLQGMNYQTPSFLGGNISAYQNPYTSQVIDQTMNDLNRQKAIDMQGISSNAVRSGAYGGSRQAIAEQELNRNYADQFARTAAQLRNQGFDTAANLMQGDLNRDIQGQQLRYAGAAGLGNIGQALQQSAYTDLNALLGAGGLQQQQSQRYLDDAYQRFMQEQSYPEQQLALRQAALGSSPMGGSATTSGSVQGPSRLGSALGGAATGAAIGGPWGALIGGTAGLLL